MRKIKRQRNEKWCFHTGTISQTTAKRPVRYSADMLACHIGLFQRDRKKKQILAYFTGELEERGEKTNLPDFFPFLISTGQFSWLTSLQDAISDSSETQQGARSHTQCRCCIPIIFCYILRAINQAIAWKPEPAPRLPLNQISFSQFSV